MSKNSTLQCETEQNNRNPTHPLTISKVIPWYFGIDNEKWKALRCGNELQGRRWRKNGAKARDEKKGEKLAQRNSTAFKKRKKEKKEEKTVKKGLPHCFSRWNRRRECSWKWKPATLLEGGGRKRKVYFRCRFQKYKGSKNAEKRWKTKKQKTEKQFFYLATKVLKGFSLTFFSFFQRVKVDD